MMQLDTSRFGPVSFTLEEVLLLDGLGSRPSDRRWLLLTDRRHRRLHWLQSVDNPQLAVPAVALRVGPRHQPLRVPRTTARQLGLDARSPVLALLPLDPSGTALATGPLVLINPHRRIGRQVAGPAPHSLARSGAQSVQTVRARKIA